MPHGKHRKRKPGCHKNRNSPETKLFEQEMLVPPRPSWMPQETYVKLNKVRNSG